MDKSLYLRQFDMELTEEQYEEIAKNYDELESSMGDGRKIGIVAIQPAAFVADRDPHIRVSILTTDFTERLVKFIQEEAIRAKSIVPEISPPAVN